MTSQFISSFNTNSFIPFDETTKKENILTKEEENNTLDLMRSSSIIKDKEIKDILMMGNGTVEVLAETYRQDVHGIQYEMNKQWENYKEALSSIDTSSTQVLEGLTNMFLEIKQKNHTTFSKKKIKDGIYVFSYVVSDNKDLINRVFHHQSSEVEEKLGSILKKRSDLYLKALEKIRELKIIAKGEELKEKAFSLDPDCISRLRANNFINKNCKYIGDKIINELEESKTLNKELKFNLKTKEIKIEAQRQYINIGPSTINDLIQDNILIKDENNIIMINKGIIYTFAILFIKISNFIYNVFKSIYYSLIDLFHWLKDIINPVITSIISIFLFIKKLL